MRLHALEVSHFAGISHAAVEFGPGLNVLYGPNELGKSSLVHAIRAALLLQDSSAAHLEFVAWDADHPPRVELVFETEPQRIWKIRKSFGSGSDGSSYLEWSKDGRTFTQDAKGREVDGRVRELLRWGLDTPGGRRGKAGLAESFLTTALLGRQDAVADILNRGLNNDPDESGKQRLTEALQALAEDPMFRSVLECAQGRVNEAFTATGRPRSGKGSPWVQLREERKLADQRRRDAQDEADASTIAKATVEQRQAALVEARQRLSDARALRDRVESGWAQHVAIEVAAEELAKAVAEHDRVVAIRDAAAATETALASARASLIDVTQSRDAVVSDSRVANDAVDGARDRLREIESGDAERARQLEVAQIEKELAGLETQSGELARQQERAKRLRDLEQETSALERDLEAREKKVASLRASLSEAQGRLQRDRVQLNAASIAELVRQLLAAEQAAGDAVAARDQVQAWRSEAAADVVTASTLRREVTSDAPTDDEMQELRSLAAELEVAEAKLQVGLSMTVDPVGTFEAEIELDEGALTHQVLAPGSHLFSANASLRLDIPGITAIHVRGGSGELQDAAAELRQRWCDFSEPVFGRVGVGDLDALEKTRADANEKLAKAGTLEARARENEARATGAGAVDGNVARMELAVADARSQLESILDGSETIGAARERVQLSDAAGGSSQSKAALERSISESAQEVSKLEIELAREDGMVGSKRDEHAALGRDCDAARLGFDEGWERALAEIKAQLASVTTEVSDKKRALGELQAGAETEVEEARQNAALLKARMEALNTRLAEAEAAVDAAAEQVARLEGEASAKKSAFEREDLDRVVSRVASRQRELDELPRPTDVIREEQREQAAHLVREATARNSSRESELQIAEGALQQVGGQYVQERLEQADEALAAVADREREIELDYGAWSILLETLKEAESEDAVHLGHALVEPIAARMAELTEQRYGTLTIGPKLETSGIEVNGSDRDLDSLSVGTRDQLATLLRLSVAEAIGSVLVLDDQLTQTDSGRMEWLRDLFRKSSRDVQIVVMTCRPEDYLLPEEVGASAHPKVGVRAVNLESVIGASGDSSQSV